jgi:hypothetical protein
MATQTNSELVRWAQAVLAGAEEPTALVPTMRVTADIEWRQ